MGMWVGFGAAFLKLCPPKFLLQLQLDRRYSFSKLTSVSRPSTFSMYICWPFLDTNSNSIKMHLSNDFGAMQFKSSGITRKHTAMASSKMESHQELSCGDAAAATKQLRGTTAPRIPFSEASTSLFFQRLRPLIKTIFVPLAIFFVVTNLVVPVAAMDNQMALAPYPVQNAYGAFAANPPPRFPLRVPLTSLGATTFLAAGSLLAMASQMLGSLMGVTSVLWFIMRNDAAVQPSFSWT